MADATDALDLLCNPIELQCLNRPQLAAPGDG